MRYVEGFMDAVCDDMPGELLSLRHWAVWALESQGDGGRMTKVPYSVVRSGRASSTDSKSWGSYEEALSYLRRYPERFRGLSFVISEDLGLTFIDVDHCFDEETGKASPLAREVASYFKGAATYCEVSQSGTGMHLLVRGNIPRSFNRRDIGLEMYAKSRFMACTFATLTDCVKLDEQQEALSRLFEKYAPKQKTLSMPLSPVSLNTMDDKEIVSRASKNPKFAALYAGDWAGRYGSHSEADLALCTSLAFWCDKDPRRMDAIFQSSGLFRQKWMRADYRESTLAAAISGCRETLSEYMARTRAERSESYGKMFNPV